ncbi:unnamed protein product [Microthlaspi erraticum]|uniref:Uncharacterized protein n=1 Tax=Microthlaspi erraticum TaxID=1685480 RepID=A0A6D2LB63_9BRAS|nr:unnamed protein product [Microthlaspi erraticum]
MDVGVRTQTQVSTVTLHIQLASLGFRIHPGLNKKSEQKKRPELTSIIAASSGSMKTKQVAKICLRRYQSRKIHSDVPFHYWVLAIYCEQRHVSSEIVLDCFR